MEHREQPMKSTMRARITRHRWLVALSATALLLAACGGSEDIDEPAEPTEEEPAAEDDDADDAADDTAAPEDLGTVTVALSVPDSLPFLPAQLGPEQGKFEACGIEVDIISTDPVLLVKGEDMAKASGVPYNVRHVETLDLDSIPASISADGRDIGCLALRASQRYRERRMFRRWRLYRLLRDIDGPVLICKRRHPYYSILNVLDDHQDSARVTELAFKLGFLLRSKLRVLRYCYLDPRGQERMVENLVRLYGVKCRDDPVEGNPTIEFVSELSSGDLDLTVVNWDSSSITHDILGRAIMDGPSSILIMRSPRNVLMS